MSENLISDLTDAIFKDDPVLVGKYECKLCCAQGWLSFSMGVYRLDKIICGDCGQSSGSLIQITNLFWGTDKGQIEYETKISQVQQIMEDNEEQ